MQMERELYRDDCVGLMPEWKDLDPHSEFDIATTLKQLERISELAAVDPSEYIPCRNDFLANNFIQVEEPEKYAEPVYIIDWEYAGMSTPYYELADMF